MSRKSKRNPRDTISQPPPAAATTQTLFMNRRNLFVVAVMALLLAFVVAMLLYKTEKVQSQQSAASGNPPALVSAQSPRFGAADAKVHIVEFLDPACETCALFFPHVKALLEANPGRLRLSVRHVPFHQGSEQVVRILEAARSQDKYLPTMEALYAAQNRWVVQHVVQPDEVWKVLAGVGLDLDRIRREMNEPELVRRVEQDLSDARLLGVTKTPEFFVNGRPLPSFGLEQLRQLVNEELRRAYP